MVVVVVVAAVAAADWQAAGVVAYNWEPLTAAAMAGWSWMVRRASVEWDRSLARDEAVPQVGCLRLDQPNNAVASSNAMRQHARRAF